MTKVSEHVDLGQLINLYTRNHAAAIVSDKHYRPVAKQKQFRRAPPEMQNRIIIIRSTVVALL